MLIILPVSGFTVVADWCIVREITKRIIVIKSLIRCIMEIISVGEMQLKYTAVLFSG